MNTELLLFIILFILILLIRLIINSNNLKGKSGERYTSNKLKSLNNHNYPGYILNNIYIPKSENRTCEIDLLYITEKGLFVIESKNYSGYIFGDQRNKNWTQTLYNSRTNKVEKYHFYNPIWQNNNHVKFLKEYLKEYESPIYSLIVFSDRCELKNIQFSSENTYVIQRDNLKSTISQIWKSTDSILDSNTTQKIYDILLPLTSTSSNTKKKHVEDIHKDYSSNHICPICGSKLVVRTAKTGPYAGNTFYGCSNYPKCHYTKDID